MKITTLMRTLVVFTVLGLMATCIPSDLFSAYAVEPTSTPTAMATPEVKLININTATLTELNSLPGIGDKIAQAIMDKRPYKTPDALLNVKGIGYKKYEKIRSLITIGDTQSEAAPIPKPTTTPKPKS